MKYCIFFLIITVMAGSAITRELFTDSYVIGPRDRIKIKVYKSPELNTDFTVRADSTISMPFVGDIKIGGLTERQAQKKIKATLENGYLVQAEIILQITGHQSKTAMVIGRVNIPGEIFLPRKITLINAISLAGGVNDPDIKKIMIIQPNQETAGGDLNIKEKDNKILLVDYKKLFNEGDMTLNHTINHKDIVIVLDPNNARGKFYITGEVQNSGVYDLKDEDLTVIKAISLAGGTTSFATTRGIIIKRTIDDKEQTLKADVSTKIKENDIIYIPRSLF